MLLIDSVLRLELVGLPESRESSDPARGDASLHQRRSDSPHDAGLTCRTTSGSDYIRFARANGLPSGQNVRYALRNALPPIITLAGVLYTILIAGAVLTETIYSWGGVGQYAVQSVLRRRLVGPCKASYWPPP